MPDSPIAGTRVMSKIILPSSMCVVDVGTLHAHFLESLEELVTKSSKEHEQEAITLDVDGITRIDTAGVQLLVSFLNEAKIRHIPVQIVGDSQQLEGVAENLGLQGLIG